jgi:hypothetical protein
MGRLDDLYFGGIGDEPMDEPPPPRLAVAPGREFALKGCVITPDQRIDDGFVHVVGDRIVAVGAAAPGPGVQVVNTAGVILPGLIDLHGHPEFNVFAPWEPPRTYARRRTWRASGEYRKVVRDPWNHLTEAVAGEPLLLPLMTRYAEARALVTGVTALQGASAKYPDPTESLVRNVDPYRRRLLWGDQTSFAPASRTSSRSASSSADPWMSTVAAVSRSAPLRSTNSSRDGPSPATPSAMCT